MNGNAPIMIRAAITQNEWRQFRSLAILENKAVQDLLGELIRKRLAAENGMAA